MKFNELKNRLKNKDLPGVLYSILLGLFVAVGVITAYSISGHEMALVEFMKTPVSEIATGQLAFVVFVICLFTK